MTDREELITLLNYISDEHAARLLDTVRAMAKVQSRSGKTQPSTTIKTLCAEDVCRMSEADARSVYVYANSLHAE